MESLAAGRVTDLVLTKTDGTQVTLASQIEYAPFGPARSLTLGNGLTETRSFDREGRITRLRSGTVLDYGYSWDATGNITGIGDNLDSTRSQAFGYDALYRLTSAQGVYGDLGYDYDAVGNRTRENDNGADTVYGYEQTSNRLASVAGPDGSASYQYDAAGNTLNDGEHNYAYDARNRFTEADGPDGEQYRYAHNALGQRVMKPRFQTAAPGDASGDGVIDENDLHVLRDILRGRAPESPGADCNQDGTVDNRDVSCIANQIGDTKNNGKDKNDSAVGAPSGANLSTANVSDGPGDIVGQVLFVYDESGHLLGEYDEAGQVIREYVWLGDRPVAMLDDTGNTYFVHADHLNTPKVVTDQEQQVVWKGDYTPFGEVNELVDTVEMNLRFPGQYEDQETGLNYNYFRSYDASNGRYTQSDPIGLRGGLNRFTYTDSAPIMRADIYGLCGEYETRRFSITRGYYCEPRKWPEEKPARFCANGWCAAFSEDYNTAPSLSGCTAKCAVYEYAVGWVPEKLFIKGVEALPQEIVETSKSAAKRIFILLYVDNVIECYEECRDGGLCD